MTNEPLISVLMTSYNREEFIAEAIESVLNSKYKNFELIVVDDCSSDKTVEIAHRYENKDTRIKVYVNSKNLGDYPNRNQAAKYAKGKYIKYLDSDDLIYPYSLSIMVDAMETFPKAAIAISQNENEDVVPYPIFLPPREAYLEHFLKKNILFKGPTASIIRRENFEKTGGFFEIRHDGDTVTILKLAAYYPIIKLQPGLVWWRRHDGQEHGKRLHKYMGYNHVLKMLESKENPLNEVERKNTINHVKKQHARILLSMFIRFKFTEFFSVYKNTKINFIEVLLAYI